MYGFSAKLEDISLYLEFETTQDRSEAILYGIYIDGIQNIIDIVSQEFLTTCEEAVANEAWETKLID